MPIPFNVLCQSPVSEGTPSAQSVRNTVALAAEAEALGYHRFWVAEHHSDRALASGAPEVLVAAIAAATERIRVGSGGVLLPYYSPFKVAERFNLLASLFPGRIDLGLGRSGGSESHAPQALGVRSAGPATFDAVDELLTWLDPTAEPPLLGTHASPEPETPAEVWILGTSPASARFAAERGLPYAFGGFLDPRGLLPSLSAYHQHFAPNPSGQGPRVNLAWNVLVAETESDARDLARTTEHWFVRTMLRKENPRFESPDAIRDATYAPMEQAMLEMMRQLAFIGTAEQVLERIEQLQQQTQAQELTVVTIPFDPAARIDSYRLLARAR